MEAELLSVFLLIFLQCTTELTESFTQVQSDNEKKNVLFIVVDDLRPALGCYDEPIFTPNIDQLRSKSIKFNNAYVQQALCGPSRTSFLTSRRPDTTKLYDFGSYWRKAAGNYTTLPQHFKEAGYFTVSTGKVFNPGKTANKTDDYPYSWSIPAYHAPTQAYKNSKVCPGPDGKLHMNLVCPVNVDEMPGKSLPDIQIRENAVDMLKNLSEKRKNGSFSEPFFLAVGFRKPHVPLKYPREFLELYPLSTISPALDPHIPANYPPVAWNPWTDVRSREDITALNVSFPYGPMPYEYELLIRQSYYAATSYMDYQVGQLLSSLDKYGFASNTIISLVADHGWSLGEHQEWSKFSVLDIVTRVPLLLHLPGTTDRRQRSAAQKFPFIDILDVEGQKKARLEKGAMGHRDVKLPRAPDSPVGSALESDALVELVDLFPTLAELAGLTPPPLCPPKSFDTELCTEGLSFVPVIKAAAAGQKPVQWKNATFSQYPRPADQPQDNSDQPHLKDIRIMGYSMRTADYRYTEWVGFDPSTFTVDWADLHARELYLLQSDRKEDVNVASSPDYASLVQKLSRQLRSGWREALPPGALNDF